MLTAHEAWHRLEQHLSPLAGTRVPRREAAGQVLAEAVFSTVDLPACNVSAMDGYAVAGSVTPGDRLPVVGIVAAGDPPGQTLAAGQTVRIMTGAPVPIGALTVVPVENTDAGEDEVVFHDRSTDGAHIRRGGEIVRTGERILDAGMPVTPGGLSLLASHGHASVVVHRSPRVAFVSTGNEVVPPDREPEPGQLRDSHTDFLLAATSSLGLELLPLGIASDSPDSLRPLLERGLDYDILLVSGGVSMGEFDIVEDVLAGLGCAVLFDKVAVQPGKPLVAARHPRGLVFGLPGNPASVMVCYWLFVRPTLRRLMGHHDAFWHGALNGTLVRPLPGSGTRDRFLPANVGFADGEILVQPAPPKGSHDLMAYARGSALVRVPASSRPAETGSTCQILPLADWPAQVSLDG
ncbi:MAG: molybdopterin molybdotransferase MoeA [Acidobacteriota bacterium]|nr:molybdopterin molybdotransferase MoeA [Acidobacteriota bacterium]